MKAKPKIAPSKAKRATAVSGRSFANSGKAEYQLYLYVAAMMPRSTQAIANIKQICEEHLKGRYDLQVINLYQQPMLAQRDQIIALPTLIKRLPHPLRRLIGDLSDRERVLVGLDIRPKR